MDLQRLLIFMVLILLPRLIANYQENVTEARDGKRCIQPRQASSTTLLDPIQHDLGSSGSSHPHFSIVVGFLVSSQLHIPQTGNLISIIEKL